MSATNIPVYGVDQLVARDSGPWAREKLNYLSRYMGMVTTAMPGKWNGLVYMDLMAGPGLCVDRTDSSEFAGSPILALQTKKPWTKAYFVEYEDVLRGALEQRIARQLRKDSAVVLPGDSNSAGIIQRLRDASEGMLSLAFVDLIGQEITFGTVRALSRDRKIDLWFSFPEMDLKRNATIAPNDPDEAARWSRFFGTDAWRPIVSSRRPGPAMVLLRNLYLEQLQSIGYKTEFSRLPMKNSLGKALYRPLFASKDDVGIDFFKKSLLNSGVAKPASLLDLCT